MSQVSFYTGVADRLTYICRLLRKAQASGAQIGVCGAPALLERLDAALWTFELAGFVPHLRLQADSNAAAIKASPVLLVERPADLPHRDMLLNLGRDMPEGFEQFDRVLEVVSQDPDQVQAGRARFGQYKFLGHEISHHLVAA